MHRHINNSYLRGEDTVNGRGNSSYFTFFCEFNRPSPTLPYIEATVLCLLFIFSTIANSTVFVTLLRHRYLRTVTNCFICNLTVSDLLYTLCGPFIASVRITQTWPLGQLACNMMVYMEFVCGSVSIWTMVMISVERYMCIVKDSNMTFTPRLAFKVIVVMWSVALLCYTPVLLRFHIKTFALGNATVDVCTLGWPKTGFFKYSLVFTICVTLFAFITPFIIFSNNYWKIFRKFWTSRKLVNRSRVEVNSTWPVTRINLRKLREARDLRVIKILFGLVIIFAAMWMPIFCVFIVILVDNSNDGMQLGSYVFIIAICCSMGNACVNPILYGVMNERVKLPLIFCVTCNSEERSNQSLHPQQCMRQCSPCSIAPIPEEPIVNMPNNL